MTPSNGPALPRFRFYLSDTALAFVEATTRRNFLIGPEGEGKTFAGFIALLRHVERCRPHLPPLPAAQGGHFPMAGLLVRDTFQNIESVTIPSLKKSFADLFYATDPPQLQIRQDGHLLVGMGMELLMLGMDDEKSMGRIQGAEFDFAWCEEPAPMLHTANTGLARIVYQVCDRRLRGRATPKRIQITMNPASKDHWTYQEAVTAKLPETSVFFLKKGDNVHLSAEDRQRRSEAFASRPDLRARYDEGCFADVFPGVAVTPDFNEQIHVAPEWLLPLPGTECVRMWDGGLHPACVLFQLTPSGHAHFLDAVLLQNQGLKQLIDTKVKPLLSRPRYQRIKRWRDLGDPSMKARDPSNSEGSPARVIEQSFGTTFEPGVNSWDIRRETLVDALVRLVAGRGFVQVNPRITEGEPQNWVRAGLAGGYSYRVTASGQVLRDIPEKNLFSHPLDAVSHSLPLLLRGPAQLVPPRRNTERDKQRAKTYGVGIE